MIKKLPFRILCLWRFFVSSGVRSCKSKRVAICKCLVNGNQEFSEEGGGQDMLKWPVVFWGGA